MNKNQIYWLLISFYGAIHIDLILKHIEIYYPFYLIYITVAVICLLLYITIKVQMEKEMNVKVESSIWLVQSLIIVLNSQASHSLWSLLFPVSFIFLEIGRILYTNESYRMKQENRELQELLSQYNDLFQVVRSERHDFLKHISAVQFMVDSKDAEVEAKQYLSQLVEGYAETNLSIKGENGAVASILHTIYKQSQEKNIHVSYDLDVPLSTLPMQEKHIVELVGNLLSNCLEACEEYQVQYKRQAKMILRMTKRSGFYLLSCKNSSMPIPESVVDYLFVKFGKSTKGGINRGYGTKIIYSIVRKYHGYLDYTHKENSFSIKIKFPAIIKNKF